ncbi:MAG: hypothetical protein KJ556_20535, partial [Gammaproteobacteria bacterium]|nr:hypothetical protein [Gammaproteobacteria bacterium]
MVDIVEVTEGRPRPTLSEAIPPPFVGMDTSDIVAITERIRPVEQSVQKLGLTQGFVMPLVREMAD